MLTRMTIKGTNQYAAAHYFAEADNYYAREGSGVWHGKGATVLGLEGEIDQTVFSRLMGGQLPDGTRVPQMTAPDGTKRMAYDFTFSAPKSFSMQSLMDKDPQVREALMQAHLAAVRKAMEPLEALAKTRKRENGVRHVERTGNIVAGLFQHDLSRALMPDIHTHGVILNMTQRADGQWRAISNEDMVRAIDLSGAVYTSELARQVKELGMAIRVKDARGNWEFAHVSEEQVRAFSPADEAIREALAQRGLTRETASTALKQEIELQIRPKKMKLQAGDFEKIQDGWQTLGQSMGLDLERYRQSGREKEGPILEAGPGGEAPTVLDPQAQASLDRRADAAVAFAIQHLSEREAVLNQRDLIKVALMREVGQFDLPELQAALARAQNAGRLTAAAPVYEWHEQGTRRPMTAAGWIEWLQREQGKDEAEARREVVRLIHQQAMLEVDRQFTTPAARAREQFILAAESEGRDAALPLIGREALQAALAETSLNPGQRAAVETMLGSPHRVVAIEGDAGTGKSYTLKTAVDLLHAEAPQTRVMVLAPYGNQVKALKQDGLEAKTLAAFLDSRLKDVDAQTVIVLDEAGVVGSRQMAELLTLQQATGARLVLLGDTKQTEAIEQGKPMAQMIAHGMPTARISDIVRQTDAQLRESVAAIAQGDVQGSLQKLAYLEMEPDLNKRLDRLVGNYLARPPELRDQTLIVTGLNVTREGINARVREGLGLAGAGQMASCLIREDLSQAQRGYAPSYRVGMVLQPERDEPGPGLARGELLTVRAILPGNQLQLAREDGQAVTVDPATLPRLSVYQRQPLELSVGDLVRNNRNDAARDLTNGDKFRVARIEAGQLQLASLERNSKTGEPLRTVTLPLDQPLHLEHGYASTIHGAQGLTYRQALVDLDTFSRTTSMNLYYVAISRARERAEVFTNDLRRLPQAIARRFSKSTAQEAERVREVDQTVSRDVAAQPAPSISPDTKEKLTAFVVDYAIAHLSEREHVFKRRDILEHALKRGVGDITQEDVAAELQRREAAGEVIAAAPRYLFLDEQRMRSMTAERWVQWFARRYDWSLATAEAAFDKARETNRMVTAEPRVTTRQIWQQEQSLMALERAGRGAATPLVDKDALQRALAPTTLNAGQREAVVTMLATPHRFVGIQGDAGTGKSFTVKSAVQLLDTTFDKLNRSSAPRPDAEGRVIMSGEEAFGRARWHLVVLAPYGSQVKSLKEDGLNAKTLEGFLRTQDKQMDDRTLILLDEAGVVSGRQMERLMRQVEASGARLVMLGDTKQTKAVEAGNPFQLLQDQQMPTTRVHEIQRQTDGVLKQAVSDAAEGRGRASLGQIEVLEVREPRQRAEAAGETQREPSLRTQTLVANYLARPPAEQRETLIVAGLNAVRQDINQAVRKGLGLDQSPQQREIPVLVLQDRTRAEKGFAASYAAGDIVVAESGDRKLKVSKGERLTVMAAQDGDRLQVRREDGSTLVYPARQLECSVFKVEKQAFAEGDVVRFTRNDAKQDVTNGDRYRVSKVESNQLELTALQPAADGTARTLTLSTQRPQPLDYAYASTVHSAQGMTYQRVLVDMDSYSRTTALDLYYVAISRARAEARLYTNDREELSKRLLLPHVKASPVQERIWLEARRQRALERQQGIEAPARSGVAGGRPGRGEGYARD